MQDTFEDIPRLIVRMMTMERSDQARRSGRTAGILPLCDDKVVIRSAKKATGENDTIRGEFMRRSLLPELNLGGALAQSAIRIIVSTRPRWRPDRPDSAVAL